MKRATGIGLVGWGLLAGIGAVSGGCILPPVLPADPPGLWDEPAKGAPMDLEFVSMALADPSSPDAIELHGIHLSAGPEAPLVLHFRQSGGHVAARPRDFARYGALADLGCSSLAFDYRGIGLSGGERDPALLMDDALAIYRHALDLVDGDEQRIVLRATSLGTVIVAGLLDAGVRPAAIVAFAPVEARSLARRFTAQNGWGLAYWPAAPFLKPLVRLGTLDVLSGADCPVLVVTDPEDRFLSRKEVADLQQAATQSPTLTCTVPSKKTTSSSVTVAGFQRHMSVVRHARRVDGGERDQLRALFGNSSIFDSRVERILAALSPSARSRFENDKAASRRLRVLCTADRQLFPEAAAAAALQLKDDEIESAIPWATSHWYRSAPTIQHGGPQSIPRECPGTFEELLAAFDLDDGAGGRWPIADILRARAFLGPPRLTDSSFTWTDTNVRALALAMSDHVDEANTMAEGGTVAAGGPTDSPEPNQPPPPTRTTIRFKSQAGFLTTTLGCEGVTSSSETLPVLWLVELDSFETILTMGKERGVLALLKLAAWLP